MKQKVKNILVTDLYCASNRGDAAILEGMLSSLKECFPEAKIKVMTSYPRAVEIINGVCAVEQKMVPFKWTNLQKNAVSLYLLAGAFFYRRGFIFPGMKFLMKKLFLESYFEADLVISSGGGFLNSFYAPANLGRFWGLCFAKILGKPVVVYAQSIGPFSGLLFCAVSRFVLNRVNLITVRDKQSEENLKNLGVSCSPIHVVTDAAFNLNLKSDQRTLPNRFSQAKRDPDKGSNGQKVSISVRKWPHYKNNNAHQKYLRAVAELADWLISKKEVQVVFASTCTGFAGYRNDDRVTACEVLSLSRKKTKKNPTILYEEHTPQELAHFYGTMDLHIGTRMHSNILALLSGTPTIAIGYEFKSKELMKLFDLENYVLDINQIDGTSLIRLVDKALGEQKAIRKQISDRLLEVKQGSILTTDLIKKYLTFNK